MRRWTLLPAALAGAAAGGILVKRVWLEKYRGRKEELETAGRESDLLYTWLLLEQRRVRLEEYFTAHGYRTVAIQGMNREGRRLFDELQDSGVAAAYGVEIDNLAAVHETLTVYRLGDDPLPPADCAVICDLERIQEKAAAIGREFPGEVVSLAQVLAWLLERRGLKPWDGAVRGWPPEALLARPNGQ